MALIKCPECGKEISDFSESCIYCGYPMHSSKTPPMKSMSKKVHGKYARSTKNTKLPFIAGIGIFIAVMSLLALFCSVQSNKAKLEDTEDANAGIESIESETTVCETTEMLETIVRLTGKTSKIADDAAKDLSALLKKATTTIEFYSKNSFTTMDDIRNYEAMWQEVSNEAAELALKLYQNRPLARYDDDWLKLRDYADIMSTEFLRCTDLDVDGDGTYTGEEISDLLKDACGKAVDSAKAYVAICEDIIRKAEKEERSTTTKSSSNKASSSSLPKSSIGESTSNKAEEVNYARHTDSDAWGCAKSIVKGNLKSPSTAKFCSFPDAQVTHLGNGKYKVTGWVDAENGFGAKIRSNFTVTYTATSGGYKEGLVVFN